MVREAHLKDIPRMVELGAEFYALTGLAEIIPYNPVSVGFLFREMLKSADSVIFVVERDGAIIGGIGGTISPAMYNFDHKMVLENFWFISEAERGGLASIRLIGRLEAWAKGRGASLILCGAFAHLKCETLGKLYSRLGYSASETLHVKGV